MAANSRGAKILEALEARLKTLTSANGYLTNVRTVRGTKSEMDISTASRDLPSIEIINNDETYNHLASAMYESQQSVILLLVAEKSWTDQQMEDFKSDIRKCLFGGSSSASGNTGVTLGGVCTSLYLVSSKSDLNLVDANRIYTLTIAVHDNRITYRD